MPQRLALSPATLPIRCKLALLLLSSARIDALNYSWQSWVRRKPEKHAGVTQHASADSSTLIIYSGPTEQKGAATNADLYNSNLRAFLKLGMDVRNAHVTTAIVITRNVSHLEPLLLRHGARVFYRRNVCYDMESYRIVLAAMRAERRVFRYYIMLNCGVFGPALPPYLLGGNGPIHWADLITRHINAGTKLVGMYICCGGADGVAWPHVASEMYATDALGLSYIEQDGAIFKCTQTKEGNPSDPSLGHGSVYTRLAVDFEMGLSRAMLKRGYNIAALNQLQQGIDWRREANFRTCTQGKVGAQRLYGCYYPDYPLGPPDVMFTKTTHHERMAKKLAATAPQRDVIPSTYHHMRPLYTHTGRATNEFLKLYGFRAYANDSVSTTKPAAPTNELIKMLHR